MTTFADNFERANGALGGNWSNCLAVQTISGGYAVASGPGLAMNTTVGDSARLEASCHVAHTLNGNDLVGPAVKLRAGVGEGFFALVFSQAGLYYFGIYHYVAGALTGDAQVQLASQPLPYYKLYICWDNGVITATYADSVTVTANNGAFATNLYPGIKTNTAVAPIADFYAVGGAAVLFSVSPQAIGNYGACSTVTLTATGTSWTPGTPGSPTFTVDHGTISAQTVLSATSATATYCPGAYLGTVVFTDPSTGLTAGALVTSDPTIAPPGSECPFNDQFIAMANQTGIDDTPGTLLTTSDAVILSPVMNIPLALDYLITLVRNLYPGGAPLPPGNITPDPRLDLIWDAINGGVAQPQGLYSPTTDQPVKLDTEQLLSGLQAVTSNGNYNLASVISLIAGSGGYNLTTLLQNLPGSDLSPILDELVAIRGDTTTSLYTLLSSLAGIRTIDALSLRDVLQAIDALPKTLDGGYYLSDRLANAAGFVGVLAAIAALGVVEAEDAASSSGALAGIIALATEVAGGVASILGILESLKKLLGGGPNEYRPPVWPGEAHVEWGTAIAIESNEPLIGEMHGVVVSITGCESGTRLFGYDGITCYSHVGALGFCSDRGDMEPFQALGPTTAIYTVKTMASAFACRLFRGRNVRGTIQPWKIRAD